jgi:hypothetical protein
MSTDREQPEPERALLVGVDASKESLLAVA